MRIVTVVTLLTTLLTSSGPVKSASVQIQEAGSASGTAANDRDSSLFGVGFRIADAVARDYPIVVGSVSSVAKLRAFNSTGDIEVQKLEMVLVVTEWLSNEPDNAETSLRLSKIPSYEFHMSLWPPIPAGKEITPKVGDQLLVIARQGKWGSAGESIYNSYWVVSDEQAIFESVRQITKRQHKGQPFQSIGAEVAPASDDGLIFDGFTVGYLRGASQEDPYVLATSLCNLLTHERIPSYTWFFVLRILRTLARSSDPRLLAESRNTVIENLVSASGDKRLPLAKEAIAVLLTLTESDHLDIRPHVTTERSIAINKNYRELKSTGQIEGSHPVFESQLGW